MHDVLSRRITKLIAATDAISPAVLKSELLDLAKLCQVVPGNSFLLRTVCGQLEGGVSAVFGHLALLLVMTEPSRRQVYFAVVARLEADGALEGPGLDEATRADLLTRLVVSRNEDLIAYAYSTCPTGFVRLIGRFGDCARKPALYLELFGLLTTHPDLAHPLLSACQGRPLTDDLIELMRELSPTPLGVRVAARFEAVGEYRKLMRPYRAITMSQQLTEAHMRRIAEGEAPGNLLEGIYLDSLFPAPVLSAPGVTHIPDGHALVRVAREFSNCLAGYVAEALNNKRQFYIWHHSEAPEVVFAIDGEAPFGWYLSEAKLVNNERLPRELRQELNDLLGGRGIRIDSSITQMMAPYRNDPDPFMFNDFLDVDEAA
jgi:hypothetical protein